MKRVSVIFLLLFVATALLFAQTKKAAAPSGHTMVKGSEVKWAPGPAPGFEIAVLSGDPSKAGPYVMRLRATKNANIAPHWHPMAENITIISGKFKIGEGDTVDEKSMHEMKSGDFATMPAKVRHYAWQEKGGVLQLHGNGPFKVNWVKPAPKAAGQKN
jgi:quercetin dioxygenase-like cupin family protein